jgi:hypothetical protein
VVVVTADAVGQGLDPARAGGRVAYADATIAVERAAVDSGARAGARRARARGLAQIATAGRAVGPRNRAAGACRCVADAHAAGGVERSAADRRAHALPAATVVLGGAKVTIIAGRAVGLRVRLARASARVTGRPIARVVRRGVAHHALLAHTRPRDADVSGSAEVLVVARGGVRGGRLDAAPRLTAHSGAEPAGGAVGARLACATVGVVRVRTAVAVLVAAVAARGRTRRAFALAPRARRVRATARRQVAGVLGARITVVTRLSHADAHAAGVAAVAGRAGVAVVARGLGSACRAGVGSRRCVRVWALRVEGGARWTERGVVVLARGDAERGRGARESGQVAEGLHAHLVQASAQVAQLLGMG